jgi:hypothetical protein
LTKHQSLWLVGTPANHSSVQLLVPDRHGFGRKLLADGGLTAPAKLIRPSRVADQLGEPVGQRLWIFRFA